MSAPAEPQDSQASAPRRRDEIAAAPAALGHPLTAAPADERIAALLERAALRADAGMTLPALAHLSAPRRFVARLAGRLALYILRLVTVEQRQFNHLMLRLARTLGDTQAAGAERLDAQIDQFAARADALDAALGQVGELADGVRERDRWFADVAARQANLEAALADLRETAGYLRQRVADRDQRLDAVLAAAGSVATTTRPAAATAPAPAPPAMPTVDQWEFARLTRGSEAEAQHGLAPYLPLFASAAPVLDIGCGRGEFLDLLRDAGVSGHGVDLNADMVLHCRSKGLVAEQRDALEYLQALPEATLGGIFACQVIEHLPAAAQIELVRLAHRVLRPGGVLVIETLNPECLMVHLRWFWMDLTHVRLMHPETLKFLLVSTGFHDLEGRMDKAASSEHADADATPAADPRGVAPDYAMIARR
jgi:SAM-dependent methyltransferase